MEAIAEGNHIMFVEGTSSYSIECSASIMDSPGAWYLWVRREQAIDPRARLARELDSTTPELQLQE